MFVLLLSIVAFDYDTMGTSSMLAQEYSSKEKCYAAGELFVKQHSRPGAQISVRWSCSPK